MAVTRFAVLLRGVNVGKGHKVPMADFRVMLEGLGCQAVQTLLNSGNAVFAAARRSPALLCTDIAAAVEARYGFATPVIVKSAAEFAAIVDTAPIVPDAAEHSRFLVAFAMDQARLHQIDALHALLQPGERLAVTEHAAYLHCRNGVLQSRAGEALLGRAGRGLTTRNWATTLKLAALLRAPAA